MSEKRQRRPAKGGQKPSNKRQLTPEAAAQGQNLPPLSFWDSQFEAIFEYVRERDEAEERERRARPKAEIIPFPKARE